MTTFTDARQSIADNDLIEARSQFGEVEIMSWAVFRDHYEGLGWYLYGVVPAANVFVDGEHRAFRCGAEAWLYADDMTIAGHRVYTDGDDNPECTCGQGHVIRL